MMETQSRCQCQINSGFIKSNLSLQILLKFHDQDKIQQDFLLIRSEQQTLNSRIYKSQNQNTLVRNTHIMQ